ncbi:uncharacterized protein LOC129574753 [Sitodiplosis mosellana]|uniref:uncharacterized protein LOC129574753 n=1 Tax=Sitodiplosis mosellana TaxID=263140 RepID=UPI002443A315|nr:uncharacterized protein LOC129574753 [Sitodiplosis mosellana]XP_055313146.1 uncharacterized protein LOC129574753 [Sitodiplosis mosellana]XP_055313147.1 uncharacterized protein LOC129574753 [Sitodiplosis mosellana]XP_055313148.1 uncharacterized protein LOC129574753 [Sitodiplosis mosellana]XP_055313149.1 uncharacterized protein LOC129574753 [Sitodiplosis mosellana]XP_055313150.1 uncharacterized protein LOC129574753 [Sitodiplosis mosellana]XP_055313151.1 uncharacterized protein LOC129574753 [
MTSSVKKDTGSFFAHGNSKQFDFVLKLYPEVLQLKAFTRCKKPEELIRLDDWYQNELPKRIKQRGKNAHLVHEELVQAMKWKQSRGKFYPQLSYLIKVNTPRAVMQETKKAFRKLPNLEQALTALSNLKGVGITMASALLAAAAPDSAPFMADECLMAIPEIDSIDYTTKEYLKFVQHIQAAVARLNSEKDNNNSQWTAHAVELALWTHFVAVQLKPELLERIPTSNTINSGSTELETTATGNNDDEETIKLTTSDDAEITADENSTDMVSSSKDEDDTTTDGDLKSEQNCISASTDESSTVLTTLGGSSQDSVTQLNGSNTVTSTTTQQSDENSRFAHFEHSNEELVQVVAANGNNKNGVASATDDSSSRSDDSSLEKPVTPIVPNDDSDSQASSNKRSLDCESSESQITATEATEPGTKKCKITEE